MKVVFEAVDFAALNYIYAKYYGMVIPRKVIRQAVMSHASALYELAHNCYFDTAARETYIDAITWFLKIGEWPCNGDSDETEEKFFRQLESAAKTHGIKDATEDDVKKAKQLYEQKSKKKVY